MNQWIKVCFVVLLLIQFSLLIKLGQEDYDMCLKLVSGVSFSKAPTDDIAKDYFDCGTKLCASYGKGYIFKICDAAHHDICDAENYSHPMQELPNKTCISGCSCSKYHCFDLSLRKCVNTPDRHSTDSTVTQSSGPIIIKESPSSNPWLLQPPYSSIDSRHHNHLAHSVGTNFIPQTLSIWRQSLPVTLYKKSPIDWQQTSPLSSNKLANQLTEKSRFKKVPSISYKDPSLGLWQSTPNIDMQFKRRKWPQSQTLPPLAPNFLLHPQVSNPWTQQSEQNLWHQPPAIARKEVSLHEKQESRPLNLIHYPYFRTQNLKPKSVNVPLPQKRWQRFQFPGYNWPPFPGFPDINSLFQGSGGSGSSGGSGTKWFIITNQPINPTDGDKKFPHITGFPDINTLFPGSGWAQVLPQGGDDGESFPKFPKPVSDKLPPAPPDWDSNSNEFPPFPTGWEPKSYEGGAQPEPPSRPAPSAIRPSGSPDSTSNKDSEKLFSGIPEKLINFDGPVPYVDLTEFLDDE